MLGVLWNPENNAKIAYDSVDFKKKYIYFNNSLLGTSLVVWSQRGDASLITREVYCLILEAFYRNTPLNLASIMSIHPQFMVLKESELKKSSLNVTSLQELQTNSGESQLYIASQWGIHRVVALSNTLETLIVESAGFCLTMSAGSFELNKHIHYYLTRLMTSGNK